MQMSEPKSYLPEEEREAFLREGRMDALYIAESLRAGEEGDEDTAWAWLAQGQMPAEVLLAIKWNLGPDFIRKKGLKTDLADEAYGKGWMEKEKYTEKSLQGESVDKTIGTFNRLLSVERYAVSSVRATREGQNLETSQRNLLKSLRELGKSGNLPLIIAVEKTIIEAERAYYANSRAMDASLKTALQELDVVQKHIGIVDDPVRYKAVDEVYSLPRSRKGGLPNDEARQALRSHHARLNNMDKARLGDVEKQLIDARKSNIFQAGKLYRERQVRALTAETLAKSERGEDVHHARDADDLFDQLGI